MEQICGMVYRIYPNSRQILLIDRTIDCSRFVYNHFLDLKMKAYTSKGENISTFQLSRMLPELKEEHPELKEVDSSALIYSLRALDVAYQSFFRRVKMGEKPGFPKFRSRKSPNQSYQTQNINNRIRIDGNYIRLPKLGPVKIRLHRPVVGEIKTVTVRRLPSGKYQVSLSVWSEVEVRENTGGEIGISFDAFGYCTSDGERIENPQYLEKMLKKIAREQRRLSRKPTDSANHEKQRKRVARLHEKVTNQRKDFQHKQSLELVRENKTICIEKVPVKDLMGKQMNSRKYSDLAIGSFYDMVGYKSKRYGADVVDVPTSHLKNGMDGTNDTHRAGEVLDVGLKLAKEREKKG